MNSGSKYGTLPRIITSKKQKINSMEAAIWLCEWVANHKNTIWMNHTDAAHGLGYNKEWIKRCLRHRYGKEVLLSKVTIKGEQVAVADVFAWARHINQAEFMQYSGMPSRTFRYVVRNNNIRVFKSDIRGFKCIDFFDALDLLFWYRVKQLTSRYFSFEKAMQIKYLPPALLQEFIVRYNLKQSW